MTCSNPGAKLFQPPKGTSWFDQLLLIFAGFAEFFRVGFTNWLKHGIVIGTDHVVEGYRFGKGDWMRYRWRYLDDRGAEVAGPELGFDDQVDAEDWLSEHWPELFEGGVTQVTLLNNETEVYGPMSLRAE